MKPQNHQRTVRRAALWQRSRFSPIPLPRCPRRWPQNLRRHRLRQFFRKRSNINSFWQRYRKWGKFTKSTDAFLFREFTTNSLYYLAHYRQFVCCVAFQKNGATRWGDTIFFVTGTEHHIPASRNVLWDSGSPGRGFRNCPLRCR